jgi:hypothetical protein
VLRREPLGRLGRLANSWPQHCGAASLLWARPQAGLPGSRLWNDSDWRHSMLVCGPMTSLLVGS